MSPSAGEGWMDWDAPKYLLDRPWLNGAFLSGPMLFPVSRSAGEGIILLPTEAGTHIAQVPYEGSKSPALKVAYEFQFAFNPVDDPDDFIAVKTAEATGAPVTWCSGHTCVDVFNATSGQTYTLTRRLANGVVTDPALPTDFATVVYLDGVIDPTAATVVGQTVTANDTGVIAVVYTPVHWVTVEVSESIPGKNRMALNVTLKEVVTGTFDA